MTVLKCVVQEFADHNHRRCPPALSCRHRRESAARWAVPLPASRAESCTLAHTNRDCPTSELCASRVP